MNLLTKWLEEKKPSLRDKPVRVGQMVFHIPFDGENYLMFKCRHCGKCCRGQRYNALMLTCGDIQRLSKVFNVDPSTFIEEHCVFASPVEGKEVYPLIGLPPVKVRYTACYLKRFEGENEKTVYEPHACQFITEDNLCSIYPHRPVTCRKFPYTTFRQPTGLTHAIYVNTPWSECEGYTPKRHLKKKWLSTWVKALETADREIRESMERGLILITEIAEGGVKARKRVEDDE